MLIVCESSHDFLLPQFSNAAAIVKEDTISRFEADAAYQSSIRGVCGRITEFCEDSDKVKVQIDPRTQEYWRQAWKTQQDRAAKYNVAADRFMELETEERYSKTRSREWKDQFDVVVGEMDVWVTKMRGILDEERIRQLVAEAGEVEAAESREG